MQKVSDQIINVLNALFFCNLHQEDKILGNLKVRMRSLLIFKCVIGRKFGCIDRECLRVFNAKNTLIIGYTVTNEL